MFAAALWRKEDLEHARGLRKRDLALQRLDEEEPVDAATDVATKVVLTLLTGSYYIDAAAARGLLRRLGRPEQLTEIHELAYGEDDEGRGIVLAPARAWAALCAQLAADNSDLIDDRAAAVLPRVGWEGPDVLEEAQGIVRRWAGLAPRPNGALAVTDEPTDANELIRLRALVEMAADELDKAGSAAAALQIRRAAFPHRFGPR